MKVGDKIYLTRRDGGIDDHIIVKVGRKWFYTHRLKFNIETMEEDVTCGISRIAYSSIQEIEDEKERHTIGLFIRKKFEYYNHLSLESLRKIEQIIKSED